VLLQGWLNVLLARSLFWCGRSREPQHSLFDRDVGEVFRRKAMRLRAHSTLMPASLMNAPKRARSAACRSTNSWIVIGATAPPNRAMFSASCGELNVLLIS